MAHQLGINIKYLKQTIHLNPVHQCNIKHNLIDQVSTVHINLIIEDQIFVTLFKHA